jgi:hypothetical protein
VIEGFGLVDVDQDVLFESLPFECFDEVGD